MLSVVMIVLKITDDKLIDKLVLDKITSTDIMMPSVVMIVLKITADKLIDKLVLDR